MDEQQALSVEATVMAIRETLMDYFKGSCIERMAHANNINLYGLDRPREGSSRSHRWRMEYQKPAMLSLGNLPIMEVSQEPDTVILHTTLLNRSPQLRAVRKGVEEFLAKYLPGTVVVEKEGTVLHA